MSLRTFLFCDFCNRRGTRIVDDRRGRARSLRTGRRSNDERAWYEGSPEDAVRDAGWHITRDGRHLCPRCRDRMESAPVIVVQRFRAIP